MGPLFGLWLYLISVPLGFLAIFPPIANRITAGNTIFQLVGIAIDFIIIVYLMRIEVKVLFSGKETSNLTSLTDRQGLQSNGLEERSSKEGKANQFKDNVQMANESPSREIDDIPIKKPAFAKVIDMSTG